MGAQGCNVEVFIEIWAQEVRSDLVFYLEIIDAESIKAVETRLSRGLVFEIGAQGRDVKVLVAIWAWEVGLDLVFYLEIIDAESIKMAALVGEEVGGEEEAAVRHDEQRGFGKGKLAIAAGIFTMTPSFFLELGCI
ncbi:hypothetical protein C1H46_012565 [Malus baccata]|uniref:Uncharacterized protein n=1 Tax=Malus baccata TaxID=106549 RepID=A0A540MSI8_MALBA|nr:hypothetical protein C1H46_012565 [Malus baccata]